MVKYGTFADEEERRERKAIIGRIEGSGFLGTVSVYDFPWTHEYSTEKYLKLFATLFFAKVAGHRGCYEGDSGVGAKGGDG